jgi:hypothetical protein
MSSKLFGGWAAKCAAVAVRGSQRLAAAAALGLGAFGAAGQAEAVTTTFTGQFGAGNTWNVYELVTLPMTWADAKTVSLSRTNPTGGAQVGHLVTLTSLAENNFVYTQAGSGGDRWIGLTDRVGAAPGATESLFEADPLTQGWAWVTGEPFAFNNWGGGEPNDASSGEDGAHLRGDGLWNDNEIGYAADQPVVDPAFNSQEEAQTRLPFVIEWDTMLATQPAGFPGSRPEPGVPRFFPSPLARMPGPNGTATAFGVREVRDLGGVYDARAGVAKLVTGTGTITDGTATRIDLGDPDDGAGAGPNPGSVPGFIPYISNVAGTDDNDIQTVIKGTIVVPAGQGGPQTFNVRSDDGFAMRILSQATPASPLVQHKFKSARTGNVDEDGSLVFAAPTGDSNTQGVIDLAPGTYDIEFTAFENGGGAFWEVSTQKGDFIDAATGIPNWLLLGDSSSVPQQGITQAAKLTANVTVRTFDTPVAGLLIADTVSTFRGNPTPVQTGSFDTTIVYDGDDICCGRPGVNLPVTDLNEFPNGGNDNFMSMMNGTLQVLDTNGAPGEVLTFGLFADDNSALHIIGQDFTAVGGDLTNTMLLDLEGTGDDWLVSDFRTGNGNALGLITLPEGNYNFEAFQMEEGGDAGLEVWVAAGDQTAGFNASTYVPLTTTTLVRAANTGLGLVAGPGTGPMGGVAGDFDADGDVDGNDFVVWQRGGSPNPVSAADLALWKANFGATGAAGSVGAVPEPAALGLAFVAGLGILAARRRR